MKCRHCSAPLSQCMIDLGTSPPSNAYLNENQLEAPERYYPLKVFVCDSCRLVQLQDFTEVAELFKEDYAYFSSVSQSWVDHSSAYVDAAVQRFSLDENSVVVEIAANDGYLLQWVKARGIPCYGVEPTVATAACAREKGLEIVEAFFGEELGMRLAGEGRSADLIVANNVLAHVPDINDFLRGFARLLKPMGVATFEFPHLLNLLQKVQFDTIYHEHYSYLSVFALERIFSTNGLSLFDVEELPTHGGSLRCYVQRADSGMWRKEPSVERMLQRELAAGMSNPCFYQGFQSKADRVKDDFVAYLINAKRRGMLVAGYGAAAKGNTLINYAGIRADLLAFVVDNNPHKQNKYLPGSRIPIVSETVLREKRPERVVILPWNIADELAERLKFINEWGGKCVSFVPSMNEYAPE
ncbi:hypothetical protein LP7551_03286 [Roseibium album]|nr:hypothetical protein LP7551_03286 [Roseibium album]